MRLPLEHLRRRHGVGRPGAAVVGAIRCYSSREAAGTSRITAVLSFGDNSMAALGLPFHTRETYEPTLIPSLPSHLSSIAAGHYHSLAVTSSGEVWAWGRNSEGQLGRGFATSRDTWHEPRKVEGLDHVKIQSVFASGVVSAAVGDDGSLWVWGRSLRGQLGLGNGTVEAANPCKVEGLEGEKITKVSFGWGHALALTSAGKLFGWGYSADGRLGRMGECLNPAPVLNAEVDRPAMAGNKSSAIEAVEKFISDKLEKEKRMPIIWKPTAVKDLEGFKVSDVACGLDHSLVLCCNGSILSCGENIHGELGRPGEGHKMLPVEMPSPPVALSAGLGHSLAICRVPSEEITVPDTRIASWGWNQSSQLGRHGEEERPGMVQGLDGQMPTSVSGGRAHSIAVTSQGEIWVWGSGANGRLGLGSTVAEPEPAPLESLAGVKVLQAVCGFDHNLILVAE